MKATVLFSDKIKSLLISDKPLNGDSFQTSVYELCQRVKFAYPKDCHNSDFELDVLAMCSQDPQTAYGLLASGNYYLTVYPHIEKPTPQKYGWQDAAGVDDMAGGWMLEGGEAEYYKACEVWRRNFGEGVTI